jgi:hypothetical protein
MLGSQRLGTARFWVVWTNRITGRCAISTHQYSSISCMERKIEIPAHAVGERFEIHREGGIGNEVAPTGDSLGHP